MYCFKGPDILIILNINLTCNVTEFFTAMDLEGTLLSEINQRKADTVLSLIMNEYHEWLAKQKETPKYREQSSGYQWGEEMEEG